MEVAQWDLRGYEYPQEILELDKRVKELQKELEEATRISRAAKTAYTKTVPPLSSFDEYKTIHFSCSKRDQYTFKRLVDYIKQHHEQYGDDLELLRETLKAQFEYALNSYINTDEPVLYVVNFFLIATDRNEFVKEAPDQHVKIGNWYIRPW